MLQLIDVKQETHNIWSIFIAGSELETFSKRVPGQFASIQILTPEGWSEPHPFTISGASNAPHIQMTIKQVGTFTSQIGQLKPGTTVKLSGPYGKFCSDVLKSETPTMIAGGIGITPFLSVIRSYTSDPPWKKATLIWCNNSEQDYFAMEEFQNIANRANITLVAVVLNDVGTKLKNNDWNIEKGYLSPEIMSKYLNDLTKKVYLCGPSAMHEAVIKNLTSMGFDISRVETERFIPPKRKPIN